MIGVRLLEASPGDSGWEVFSLDYIVDAPLNAVVHLEAMSRYRIAFQMLWRLKRVEWSLSGSLMFFVLMPFWPVCMEAYRVLIL
jgi:gamma-tubulin complex component 3